MAEWRVYEADTPQCTACGMWMPFARYRRGGSKTLMPAPLWCWRER